MVTPSQPHRPPSHLPFEDPLLVQWEVLVHNCTKPLEHLGQDLLKLRHALGPHLGGVVHHNNPIKPCLLHRTLLQGIPQQCCGQYQQMLFVHHDENHAQVVRTCVHMCMCAYVHVWVACVCACVCMCGWHVCVHV